MKYTLHIILAIILIIFGFVLFQNKIGNVFGATYCFPQQGCTGTSTAPTYGQLLVGNSGGTYTLTATSSLGITATGGGGSSHWATSTANSSAIQPAGATRVGISTSSPYANLTVWGTSGSVFEAVSNASSSLFTVLNDGTIGIGTTTLSALDGIEDLAGKVVISNRTTDTHGLLISHRDNNDTSASPIVIISNTNTPDAIFENRLIESSISLFGNYGSAAKNDDIANIDFRGRDSNKNPQTYASITGFISTSTNGREEGRLQFSVYTRASATNTLSMLGPLVGVGTTSPYAVLSVVNATSTPSFVVEDQNGDLSPFIITADGLVGIGTTTPYAKLSVVGDLVAQHLYSTSTPPTVSSCGTSPSVVGSDGAGKVTLGTSIGVDNTCTVTFATAWNTVPSCMANNETQVLLIRTQTTKTVLTLSVAATFTDSDVISYLCLAP